MNFIVHHTPFEHCVISNWLTKTEEISVLETLEQDIGWKRQRAHFYTHSSVDLSQVEPSSDFSPICSREKLSTLKLLMEQTFHRSFCNEIRVWIHKMTPGDGIGIHNDNCDSELRVVLQLNRGWHAHQGGLSVFLSRKRSDFIERIYLPVSNSVIAFPTTRASYHAVTDVMEGTRFSIVYVLSCVQ